MVIESQAITRQQASAILASHESHFIDLKAREIEPSKLTRHLSAFANADGGEVYVGIFENKQTEGFGWRGKDTVEAWNAHIQVIEELFPLGSEAYCDFLECESLQGIVLKISISKSSAVKRATNGTPYVRRGAQSLPCDSFDKIKRLEYTKGIATFEDELIESDVSVIENSEAVIKFMIEVVPSSEPSMWLRKQRLIVNDKPCCAGVLLFSDEPQALLPKRSGIKIYRYKTSDPSGSRDTLEFDPITIDGCVYDQIFTAVEKVIGMIGESKILGAGVFESVQYPQETLHEVITNAVLHRDYSLADDVHIRIFDNRVEVESPGKLPAHITVKNILEERFARNCKIVRLINKFPNPPNKDVGEGLNTAFEAMRKLNLREPIITEKDNSVLVSIRHEPLASPEEVIMEYLKTNTEINNSRARAICHIGSENKMKRVFEKMISHNLIERIPERRGRAIAYRTTGPRQDGALK
jgi:ATP-dependent DNA helicase RecG